MRGFGGSTPGLTNLIIASGTLTMGFVSTTFSYMSLHMKKPMFYDTNSRRESIFIDENGNATAFSLVIASICMVGVVSFQSLGTSMKQGIVGTAVPEVTVGSHAQAASASGNSSSERSTNASARNRSHDAAASNILAAGATTLDPRTAFVEPSDHRGWWFYTWRALWGAAMSAYAAVIVGSFGAAISAPTFAIFLAGGALMGWLYAGSVRERTEARWDLVLDAKAADPAVVSSVVTKDLEPAQQTTVLYSYLKAIRKLSDQEIITHAQAVAEDLFKTLNPPRSDRPLTGSAAYLFDLLGELAKHGHGSRFSFALLRSLETASIPKHIAGKYADYLREQLRNAVQATQSVAVGRALCSALGTNPVFCGRYHSSEWDDISIDTKKLRTTEKWSSVHASGVDLYEQLGGDVARIEPHGTTSRWPNSIMASDQRVRHATDRCAPSQVVADYGPCSTWRS